MFRRTISMSSVVCAAQEALRQAIEVELGSRIEFRHLDIDPGKERRMRDQRIHVREMDITLKGAYWQLDDGSHHIFKASLTMKKGSALLWFADKGEWLVFISDELTTSYDITWKLESNLRTLAHVDRRSMPRRDYINVGRGYGENERWQDPIAKEQAA